jgi:phospholipase/lecithinase/hemolysin
MKSEYTMIRKQRGRSSEPMLTYGSGTPTEDYLNTTCGIPVNEYFWLNSLHPTYPMHDVLAEEIAKTLAAGPNIC